MTLRNSGKVGFRFSIVLLQEDEVAEEEAGAQHEEQQPDARKEKEQEGKEEGQKAFPAELRPGQPMVIPATVSLAWLKTTCQTRTSLTEDGGG